MNTKTAFSKRFPAALAAVSGVLLAVPAGAQTPDAAPLAPGESASPPLLQPAPVTPEAPLTAPPPAEVAPSAPVPSAATPDPTLPAVSAPSDVAARTAEKPEEEPPVVKASKDGFSLSSKDKSFVIKLRGYAQADARLFFDDVDEPPPHAFLMRRVRPIFEGTLYEYFGFRIMPDFGGGQTVLQDAHLDVRPLKEVGLRFGKFKAPFGLERLQSATNLLFIERGLPTQLAPNRDIGVQAYGEIANGTLQYALGIFNGVPDGSSADTDVDEHKDFVARVFAHPLRPAGVGALKDFGIGVAVSTGTAEGTLASAGAAQYRTTGQQAFFRYRAAEGNLAGTAVADGRRTRVSPQLYYYFGPFGLIGEYVLSANRVAVGGGSNLIENRAWQVGATVAIGGTATFEGIKPSSSVGEGGIGAFEVSARYQGLRIDEDAFPTYADPARAASAADGFGVGIGWWANRSARFMANFESTSFDGGAASGADRATEKVVLFRSQLSW